MNTHPSDITWETVAFLPDCLVAALGDQRIHRDDTWLKHSLPFLRVLPSGYGMVYALAECDGLPVETGHSSEGIVGVRLEFTNDVADLESDGLGEWLPLGRLRIGSQGALAADTKHETVEGWFHHIAIPEGWYSADVFKTEYDNLGTRLILEQ